MARIGEKMIGSPIEPDALRERATQEQCVVVRVTPQSFSPAR